MISRTTVTSIFVALLALGVAGSTEPMPNALGMKMVQMPGGNPVA